MSGGIIRKTGPKIVLDIGSTLALAGWIADCQSSGIAELKTFAEGMEREEDIIRAALEMTYSNGVTEGHVNRLKMIKRTAYGRASFGLLRQRVLARM